MKLTTLNSRKLTKTFAIIFMLATVLGVFVISSSAQEARAAPDTLIPSGVYTFNETLPTPSFLPAEENFNFYINNYLYEGFAFSGNSDNWVMKYNDVGDLIDVYSSTHGWTNEYYRNVIIPIDYTPNDGEFASWFMTSTSEDAPVKGMYYDILDILTSTIYDKDFDSLDSFERMSVVLLSTFASVVVVALPLIVIFWLIKFIFGFFKYF